MNPELWFTENYTESCGLTFKVREVLYTEYSKYQRLDVVDTYDYGKVMLLDGFIMFTERDEFVYHEMITQPAVFIHPYPKDVLVIGGGDGGAVRELAKHEYLNITEVEIDEVVVKAAKEYFPNMASGYYKENVELVIGDGIEFVKNKKECYDIVIIDSTDPFGPAEQLFGVEFYGNVMNALREGGIVVAQGENPYYDPRWMRQSLGNMKAAFGHSRPYLAYIPTYPSGMWSFSISWKSEDDKYYRRFDRDRFERLRLSFNYYNSDMHFACFALPEYVKRIIK